MNADEKKGPHQDLTEAIISVAFDVSNSLGCGFLEKVYENALVVGLRRKGLRIAQQVPIRVLYEGETVGDYVADLIAEDAVLVETKATLDQPAVYEAQVLNYLKITNLPVGLLLNFGLPRLGIKRLMLSRRLSGGDSSEL